jgi:transposase
MTKQTARTTSVVKDARSLKPEELRVKRSQIVQLYIRGLNCKQIAAETGMSDTAVARITKLYISGGEAALEPQMRGRRIEIAPKVEIARTIQHFIYGGAMRMPKTKP